LPNAFVFYPSPEQLLADPQIAGHLDDRPARIDHTVSGLNPVLRRE